MIDFLKKGATYTAAMLSLLFMCRGGIGTSFGWSLFGVLAGLGLGICVLIAWLEVYHWDRDGVLVRCGRVPTSGPIHLALNRGLRSVLLAARDDERVAQEANRIVRKGLDKRCIKYRDYRKWRRKNPLIFTAILDPQGELVGFFDVFPLMEEAAVALQEGRLAERELVEDHIMPEGGNAQAKYVYIASVMVNPRQAAFSDLLAREIVLLKLGQFLREYFPADGRRQLMAYAHTREGESLLRHYDFKNLLLQQDARQQDPFYVLKATEYAMLVSEVTKGLAVSVVDVPGNAGTRAKRRRPLVQRSALA